MILVKITFDERRLHRSGGNAVDPQLFGVIDGDLAGHGLHGSLAGTVGKALLHTDRAGNRTNVHDGTTDSQEKRKRGLGDEEDAVDVDSHYAIEIVFRSV